MNGQELRDATSEALAVAFRNAGSGALVNRFVALVEVLDTDGERRLWQVTSEGMKVWETLGMLECARAEESQVYIADTGDDDA